jgi:DNA-binding transcriptional MocR family regulator
VPLKVDGDGIDPQALAETHAAQPLAAIYIQPTIHNPLGTTMSMERRATLAATLVALKLYCIEDAVFSFLKDVRPLASFAPDFVIHLDCLSKRFAPGASLGFLVTPPAMTGRFANVMRTTSLVASSLLASLVRYWISDGTIPKVAMLKRQDAIQRQNISRDILSGFAVSGDPGSYHLWLALPDQWRADAFVVSAAQRGVAITPGSAFAAMPAHSPNAVRVAISSPAIEELRRGLLILRGLLGADPHDTMIE